MVIYIPPPAPASVSVAGDVSLSAATLAALETVQVGSIATLPVANGSLAWIEGTVNGLTTMTRPADVTAYANGDEVSNDVDAGDALPWEFANVAAANGGPFAIHAWAMETSHHTAPFVVTPRIYDAAPAMVGDNAAFVNTSADYTKFFASLSISGLGAGTAATRNLFTAVNRPPLIGLCAAASRHLYIVLVAGSAYTPASAQTFKMKLLVSR